MSHKISDLNMTMSNQYDYAIGLLSETFWNERWEDVFDTLEEDMADDQSPLLILYYEKSDKNDALLTELNNAVKQYDMSLEDDLDEEYDFPTTMDKFEHFTGNSAWELPEPFEIAVSDNTSSYAYPKWSDVKGDGVVVLDIFDGNTAWT